MGKVFVLRILGVVLALLLVLAFSVLETSPRVSVAAAAQVNHADSVKPLMKQVEMAMTDRRSSHRIHVSEHQFDSIVGMVQRGIPSFNGTMDVADGKAGMTFTQALAGDAVFLNISLTVLPADRLQIEHVSIGDLVIPGDWFLALAEYAVNYWTKSDVATQAQSRVQRVTLDNQGVSVYLAPLDQLLSQLNTLSFSLSGEQNTELQSLTAYYLRYISGRELALYAEPQPLRLYMREGFLRARERSQESDPVLHNKATILALAVFVGHHRLANLIGDIQPDPKRALKPRQPALLRGREDLARHFIISAALKLLSEEGVSLAIGEFKELMDRAKGGSGYSFVDLAADMAGVAFADVATSPERALALQHAVIRAGDEGVFMPDISGLPEGLSKQAFEQAYGGVDSPAYLEQVAIIRERLAAIPLYQTATP
ncbi:hypothetical protein [Alteromonas sp. CYL-A6]|uniref:hypothetical protein n=1 Tax=Alteromonas nitratireducens TaxID=3390813 RepID=UPI0034AE6ADE